QRRQLYGFVRSARRPVSREEAAAAVGISRKLAAFHMDKLAEAGLLRFRFLPPGGSRVGRRPKGYEPADESFQVSPPARPYDVLSGILVEALLTDGPHESTRAAAHNAAHRRGLAAGGARREEARPGRLGSERALTLAGQVLAEYGFEPDRTGSGCLRLRNCPFHPLAQDAPEFVCDLNHAFICGLVGGLQATTIDVVLAPTAG